MESLSSGVNEKKRLEALYRYEVLDTLPERALDDLTTLISQICEVPMALISLVDQDRQWFKSKVGETVQETPRALSFCAHALDLPDLLVVPDATLDERFAHNPLVTQAPPIRFYAGAPLRNPEGYALGTLCVIDHVPRTLSPLQEEALRVLGDQVMAHLELRRHSRELQESEERSRAIVESALDAIVTIDHEDLITEFNPAAQQMFGRSKEDVLGQDLAEVIIPPELREAHRQGLKRFLQSGEKKVLDRRLELRALRADETEFPVELTATRLGTIKPPKFTAFLRDITERQEAEQALRESEARLFKIFENSPVGLAIHRWSDRSFLDINPAFSSLTGWKKEEVIGRTALDLDLVSEETALWIGTQLKSRGNLPPTDVEVKARDGTRLHFLMGVEFVDLLGQKHTVSTFVDLTERKKLEQQFLRAQRLESIGTLAGGIAHDLNNLLSPIILSVDLLKMDLTDDSVIEVLDLISSNAQRGADMVRQVLSFSRGLDGQRLEIQIRHIVKDLEKIVQETFPKLIEIRTDLPRDLWTLLGDPTQLHQALLNLCLNARDAMPEGGTLSLSACNLRLDEQYTALIPEAETGPYVLLTVEDSGCGIPADLLDKIFDPFVTTKEFGMSSGLGLSSTLAIVKSHGGFLRVQSEVGQGTLVEMFLPSQREEADEDSQISALELPRGQGETVLVVDDEQSVRQVTRQTLEAFGYRVLLAENGVDALATLTLRGDDIDVVLTDMVMPVMDGPTLIQALRKLRPGMPIVAASGYTPQERGSYNPYSGVDYFLSKPYTAETLLKVLQKILRD